MACHLAPPIGGLAWGTQTALFCGVLPYGYILYGVHRGRWADRHIRGRRQRIQPLLVSLASVAIGLATVQTFGGPAELFALVIAMLAGLAAILSVTAFWKASLHAAVTAGSVVVLTFVFDLWATVAAPVLGVVCWSRIATGDHTPAQVTVGAVLGALAAGVIFPLVR